MSNRRKPLTGKRAKVRKMRSEEERFNELLDTYHELDQVEKRLLSEQAAQSEGDIDGDTRQAD